MPVIHTSRNRVVADEPEAADAFVQVVWFGPPQDGRHRKQFHTRAQPIEQYQEAVDWAVSMADAMAHPLYVVPLTVERAYPREFEVREAAYAVLAKTGVVDE